MKEIIREKNVTYSIYVTDDGKEFNDEFEAKVHENEMKEAIMEAKLKKIMGSPIMDTLSQWTYGDHAWYKCVIESHQDLVDFITIIEKKFDDTWDFNKSFVKDVSEALENGEVFRFIAYESVDGNYLSRYDIRLEGEAYEQYMRRFEESKELLDVLKDYVVKLPAKTVEE